MVGAVLYCFTENRNGLFTAGELCEKIPYYIKERLELTGGINY